MRARNRNTVGLMARRRVPVNPATEAQIGDASVTPIGYTLGGQMRPSSASFGHAFGALVDGHACPSIFAVSLLASTKPQKLMGTLFVLRASHGIELRYELRFLRPVFSSLGTYHSSRLFSTRVLSNNPRKSRPINKTAKIGRHTFSMFATSIPKSERNVHPLRQNPAIQGRLVALRARLSMKEPEPHLEDASCA